MSIRNSLFPCQFWPCTESPIWKSKSILLSLSHTHLFMSSFRCELTHVSRKMHSSITTGFVQTTRSVTFVHKSRQMQISNRGPGEYPGTSWRDQAPSWLPLRWSLTHLSHPFCTYRWPPSLTGSQSSAHLMFWKHTPQPRLGWQAHSCTNFIN